MLVGFILLLWILSVYVCMYVRSWNSGLSRDTVKTMWAPNWSVSAGFYQAYSQLHSLETQHNILNGGWIAFPNTPHNFLHASSFIGSQNVHFVPAVSFCMAPRKCEVVGNIMNSYLSSRLHYMHCFYEIQTVLIASKQYINVFIGFFYSVLFGSLNDYGWIPNHFAGKCVKGTVKLLCFHFNCQLCIINLCYK